MVKAGVCSLLVGFAFGSTLDQIPDFYFFAWVALVVCGVIAGKVIQRIASYKMGPKIAAAVSGGIIAGLMLSPARETTSMLIVGGLNSITHPDPHSALATLATTRIAAIIVFTTAATSQFLNYR